MNEADNKTTTHQRKQNIDRLPPTKWLRYPKDSVFYKDISIPRTEGPFGKQLPAKVPLHLVWSIYRSTQQVEPLTAIAIATLGALASGETPIEDQDKVHAFMDDLLKQLALIDMMWIEEIFRYDPERETTAEEEEALLSFEPKEEEALEIFLYALLKQRQLTYPEAAEFASEIRGKQFTPGAWRMHLTRWARKRGVPALEGRGRPPIRK